MHCELVTSTINSKFIHANFKYKAVPKKVTRHIAKMLPTSKANISAYAKSIETYFNTLKEWEFGQF